LWTVPATAQEYAHDHLLVRYRGGARRSTVLPVRDVKARLESLRRDPGVELVEPDYVRRRWSVTPDDPMFAQQWALPMVHAPQAWATSTGSPQVTVAVIDTGILPHPDLMDRLVPGYDFISDPSSANDGDGRDPDPTDTGDATEASSALHGMHVTGVLGASSNNHLGVAGVDWQCRIQPVRALGVHGGTGLDSDIADAIRWAAGLHVDGVPDNATPATVINLSFGGKGTSQTMQAAVDDAIAAGATVVAAAGNLGVDASGDSPAGLRGVITVGAVDPTGARAAYSNYGPALAIMAPGGMPLLAADGSSEGILSTLELPTSGFTYAYYAGTSQATAFVSGAVSLMKSIDPSIGPDRARSLLLASADASARCPDPDDASKTGCGAGLVELSAALTLASNQKDCTPACGADSVCQSGACVSLASLVPASLTVAPTSGGCSTSGQANPSLAGLLLMTVALIVLSRRKV
jgi:serine protease